MKKQRKTEGNGGKRRRRLHAAQPRAARFCPWAPGRTKEANGRSGEAHNVALWAMAMLPMYFRRSDCCRLGNRKTTYMYKECRTVSVCNKACVASRTKKRKRSKTFNLQEIQTAPQSRLRALHQNEENDLLGVSRASPLPSMTVLVGSVGRWVS